MRKPAIDLHHKGNLPKMKKILILGWSFICRAEAVDSTWQVELREGGWWEGERGGGGGRKNRLAFINSRYKIYCSFLLDCKIRLNKHINLLQATSTHHSSPIFTYAPTHPSPQMLSFHNSLDIDASTLFIPYLQCSSLF